MKNEHIGYGEGAQPDIIDITKVTVSAAALFQVLSAFRDHPSRVNELYATQKFADNPVSSLLDEYNSWAATMNAQLEQSKLTAGPGEGVPS